MFAKRHGRERLAFVPLHTPLLVVAWILAFCMYGEGVLAFLPQGFTTALLPTSLPAL